MASSELIGERPLSELTAAELLASLASPGPALAAGTGAALAGGLAAALLEKACAITLRRSDDARLRELRDLAAEARTAGPSLAGDDATAYARVIEAQRLPADDPSRAERLATALSDAAEPPLAIARRAAQIAALAAEAVSRVGPALRGEAVAGALLAEAAASAAAVLVAIDLAEHQGDPRLERARRAARSAQESRDRALGGAP